MKQIVPYTTDAAWLAERTRDITSTESAALFNASPYITAFELFHAKREAVVVERDDTPRMQWGRRLQDPIAQGVAEDHGVRVRKMTEYIRETDARIGASFDFQVIGADQSSPLVEQFAKHGPAVMEIKTVDQFVFRDEWLIDDGEVIEAPPHIELQVQHQMLTSGMRWALIVALVGGNRVTVIQREYDPTIGDAIMRKAVEFWRMVDTNVAPSADYTRDAERIAHIYLETTAGKTLDARDDETLSRWAEDYVHCGDLARAAARDRETTRARILERVSDAARVMLPGGSVITLSTVRESLIPAHARSAYRSLRISTRKESQ